MTIEARAGDYIHKVRVYANEPTTNTDGQLVEGDTDNDTLFCTRSAKITPAGGGERFQAQQTIADLTHRVRIRYDWMTKQITPKMWLVLEDGTRLDIERSFDVDFQHIEVEMQCKQRE